MEKEIRVSEEATAGRDQPHSTGSPTYINREDRGKKGGETKY